MEDKQADVHNSDDHAELKSQNGLWGEKSLEISIEPGQNERRRRLRGQARLSHRHENRIIGLMRWW